MASLIKRAVGGQRAAMYRLLELYKPDAYRLAYRLLGDDNAACAVVVDVFTAMWGVIHAAMTEEDFKNVLLIRTAEGCKRYITRKNNKALRIPQDRRFEIPTGAAISNDGDTPLDKVHANFTPLQWFIFVTTALTELPRDTIAAILKLDVRTLDLAVDAQKNNIARIIKQTGIGGSYDKLTAALAEDITVPAAVKNQAEEEIRRVAAPMEKKARAKTIKITVLIVVICAAILGLCVGIILSISNVEEEPPTTGETATDSNYYITDLSGITPTHYADITIKDHGTITVALDGNIAPKTVENFKKLADAGFYNGLTFHRIMEGFMMQGGDPEGNGSGGSDEKIVGEFSNNGHKNPISHRRGAISMARSNEYNSASSQFFIVHEDSTFLDGDYAAFGFVTDDAGLAIVDKICTEAEPTDNNGTIPADNQPIIESVTVRTA